MAAGEKPPASDHTPCVATKTGTVVPVFHAVVIFRDVASKIGKCNYRLTREIQSKRMVTTQPTSWAVIRAGRFGATWWCVAPGFRSACLMTSQPNLLVWRQIESVVIDSSVFERDRGDNYRLGFSLRNTAAIEIASTSIELSVTNAQEQTLIRRVFQPAEFAASTPVLGAAAEWSTNLVLGVKTNTPGDRVTGYRLLMFYP